MRGDDALIIYFVPLLLFSFFKAFHSVVVAVASCLHRRLFCLPGRQPYPPADVLDRGARVYCCSDVKPLAAEMQALFLLNPAFLLDEEAYANHGEMKEENRESDVQADNRGGGGKQQVHSHPKGLKSRRLHSTLFQLSPFTTGG